MAQITPIRELNPDRIPVTLRAAVISLRDSPRPEVSREGRLEDETGIVPFSLRSGSPAEILERNQRYIFHRAGLERAEGKLQVVFDRRTAAYPIAEEADVHRTMLRITRLEEAERKRYARGARIIAGDRARRSRRNIFSISITAGLFLWAAAIFLYYTRPGRAVLAQAAALIHWGRVATGQVATESRTVTVEETLEGGIFTARSGDELWKIGYLGLEIPPMPRGEGATINPVALRANNFSRFRIGGKSVRLEFEEDRLPADGTGEAYVFEGGKMVNLELLEQGLARLADRGRGLVYGREMRAAEETARKTKMGVWRE